MARTHTLTKLSLAVMLLTATACLKASGALFSVSSSGAVLTITTTTPNHTYQAAGIKITSPGYSLANPGSECTPSANGYCLFSVSNTTSHDISISGASGTVSYSLCLNGTGPLSCQTYQSAVSSGPTVAYVTNYGANEVLRCPIVDGVFDTCSPTGSGFSQPAGIAVNTAGTMAYIADTAQESGQISYCSINSNKSFDSCNTTNTTGFYQPVGIALNAANTYVYGTDASNGAVFRCPIDPANGSVGTCVDSGVGLIFSYPQGIALNTTGTKAYIVNTGNNNVSVCSVGISGSFSSCYASNHGGVAFNSPALMSLSADGGQAYIANIGNNTVSVCPILSGGDLGDCIYASNTGSSFQDPSAVGLSSGTNAYVVNYGTNSVYQCPITDDGFGDCQDAWSSGTAFNGPYGIALK